MPSQLPIHSRPCSGCPYRQDCPSGVWDKSEYQKLAEYDRDTANQPIGVFLCHDGDRQTTLCLGWLDCHKKSQLLALRLAVSMGSVDASVFDLPPSDVPVFGSGAEVMAHGTREIKRPKKAAKVMQAKLVKRHPELLPKYSRPSRKRK